MKQQENLDNTFKNYKHNLGKLSVLNFNYTKIDDDIIDDIIIEDFYEKEQREVIEYIKNPEVNNLNIHGTLEDDKGHKSNIIFGIDLSTVNEIKNNQKLKDYLLQFTKSYRSAVINNKNGKFILDNHYDAITFYGHSLSEADYSYFQTIFDQIKIYDSNTILIFYVNEHRPEKEIDNIFKMLNKYDQINIMGKNERNLINKLNLENRLKIETY